MVNNWNSLPQSANSPGHTPCVHTLTECMTFNEYNCQIVWMNVQATSLRFCEKEIAIKSISMLLIKVD